MNKPKIVSDYLEAAVPKGLTASRRKLIADELEDHIYQKAEHYIEIGYSEEESFLKAVAEMGDAEAVNESFEKVYADSKPLAAVVGICMVFLAVPALLFGFSVSCFPFDVPEYQPAPVQVFISCIVFCALVLGIEAAYYKKRTRILLSFAVSLLLMLLCFFLPCLLLQPMSFSVSLNVLYTVERLTGKPLYSIIDNYLPLGVAVLTELCTTVIFATCCILVKKQDCERSNPPRFSARRTVTVTSAVLAVFTVLTLSLFTVSGKYYQTDYWSKQQYSQLLKSAQVAYNDIDSTVNLSQAEKILENIGLISHADYEKTLSDVQLHTFRTEVLSKVFNKSETADKNVSLVFFPKEQTDRISDYIILTADKSSAIIDKSIYISSVYDPNDLLYTLKGRPQEIYKLFLSLHKGDREADILKAVEELSDLGSVEGTCTYSQSGTQEKYRLYSCVDLRQVFEIFASETYISADLTLEFNDGKLSDASFDGHGKSSKYNFDDIGTVSLQ